MEVELVTVVDADEEAIAVDAEEVVVEDVVVAGFHAALTHIITEMVIPTDGALVLNTLMTIGII